MQTDRESDQSRVRNPSDPAVVLSGAHAFWQLVTRLQWDKLDPWIALRNTIGITLPVLVGAATGAVASGLAVSTGALNVAFTDSHTPYVQRGQRMLRASVLVGLAVFLGSAFGSHHLLAVALTMGWAFAAGLLVALSGPAADVGTITLVTLLVYSSAPLPIDKAAAAGLFAFAGGLLQTLLAVALWPVRKHAPERNSLGELYAELARFTRFHPDATQSPPGTAQATAARDAVAAIAGDHSVEADRYRALLTQAERLRLGTLTLTRLRVRVAREYPNRAAAEAVEKYLNMAGEVLESIATHLLGVNGVRKNGAGLEEVEQLTDKLQEEEGVTGSATIAAARHQMDALNGQLRAALDLATSATPKGEVAFGRREAQRPARLQLEGTFAILRANLSLHSAALRHAVRLSVCVGIGHAIGRALDLQRAYWLPMTIAIILKPDFSATFSRGVLRLAGTFVGLVLATVLFHIIPLSPLLQVACIAALTYALRWLGPANYGIFVTAVTALVVMLVAMGGRTAPNEVIVARGLNTLAGGVIALVAYAVWPTWERLQVPEALAQLLDSYREYFRAIKDAYVSEEQSFGHALDSARSKARLARTNLEASVDRLAAEPRVSSYAVAELNAMLATSHRLVHALMALEAGLITRVRAQPRQMFFPFANQVELTLYYLANGLRGAEVRRSDLPDLREAHRQLVHSAYYPTEQYALVNVETDRMTNALNTLTEEILSWTGER